MEAFQDMPRIFPLSLRARLLVIVALAIVPGLVFVLKSGFEQRELSKKEAQDEALRVARLVSASQERFIEGARQLLLVLSRLPEIQNAVSGGKGSEALLSDLLKVNPLYANFGIVDENGDVVSSVMPLKKAVNLGDRTWFQIAKNKRAFAIGDYQIGRITGVPTLNFSQPLISADGRFYGEVFTALDLKWVRQISAEAKLDAGFSVMIFDTHGMVLSRTSNSESWSGKSASSLPLYKAIVNKTGESTQSSIGPDGVPHLYATVPMRGEGETICAHVSVGIPESVAYAKANSLMKRNILLLAVTAVAALLLAWFFGNHLIVYQITELVEATRQIAAGNFGVRIQVPRDTDELNQLANSMNDMADALQHRISEREQAEKKSKMNEERFQGLFEASPDAIFVEDFEGNVLDVNLAACLLHEKGREELLGKNVTDLVPEFMRNSIGENFKKWASGELKTVEGVSLASDGRQIPVEVRANRINFGGKPALLFHVRDITERKHAELELKQAHDELEKRVKERTAELALANDALREGQERFEIIMQGTNEGIWDWNIRTNEVYFSRRWKTMLGYNYDEIENRFEEWLRLLHPEEREHALATVNEYLTGKAEKYELEHRLLHKDGTYRWILARGAALRDETGKPYRMAGSHVDLTQRRKAEEELRELHNFLDSIVENIPDMIFVKDAAELRFVRVNKAGEQLLGLKREQLFGKSDRDFFPEEEARFFIANDRAALDGKLQVDVSEEPIHTRSGMRILHTKKIPLYDKHGDAQYLLGISEDITERKRAEEKLAKTAEELRRSNLELEQFAYVASHDLQEPLRMVASYTQLLEKRYRDRLDDEAREFIRYAVNGAHRMQVLINDLLAYSRAGTRELALKETDCGQVLGAALENLKIAIAESGSEIVHEPLPTLLGDPGQLTQLFQNLVGNALKFCGEEKPRVHVAAKRGNSMWHFSVRDNGIGIEPQYCERIFQIFQRLHSHEKYPGTGIGLALCKRIVERHGGSIWLESQPGSGTTFHFTIADMKKGAA